MHTLTILVSSRNRLHNAESHEWSKHGIKWTDSSRLTDLDFADDLSLLAETIDILQEMTTNLETEAEKVGLKISAEKTKCRSVEEELPIQSLLGNKTWTMWNVSPTLAVL